MIEKDALKIWIENISAGDSSKLERAGKAYQVAIQKELTDVQREYFLAYFRDGLNYAQISRKYGIDKSTVCRTVHRAMDAIQHCLEYAQL